MRTGTFADALALAVKLHSRLRRTLAHRTAQALHVVNLPTASDIARLREQVALLDHELRRLSHGVEDAAHAAAESSRRAEAGAADSQPDTAPNPPGQPDTLRKNDSAKPGKEHRSARAAQPRSARPR